MSAALVLAVFSLAMWIYLLGFRGMFWLTRERDDGEARARAQWPSVTAIVPARDEAETIAQAVGSLLTQDYPGDFRIVLVDDRSGDGTAAAARRLHSGARLAILSGAEPPSGWTGKLWALKQGIDQARKEDPDYLWFTDADIAHTPDNLRCLVARAEDGRYVLVSLMAKLHCESFAERFLVPAFVFYFKMLFPFSRVNRRDNPTAAAAGGCMLVRREALERAGGIQAVRREIIDDCALARRMKQQGGIWLGLTERAVSLRRYPRLHDIRRMIVRSAYAQLNYSPVLLAGTIAAMTATFALPPLLALLGAGTARFLAGAAWLCMAAGFQPMLRFYRRVPLWGLALPLVGIVYTVFTVDSAIQFWRGRGGLWKGRYQTMTRA
jgi:hopene-associated glycosyltransferase HpnB